MVRGLVKLRQERGEQLLLRLLPGLDGIIEQFIAAQMVALSLEANRGPPCPLAHVPIHTGNTTGVVAPSCTGPNHLHAGAIHVGQAVFDSRTVGTTAADRPSVAETAGFDDRLIAAVTVAEPSCAGADVFRRGQDGEFSKPLSGQIKLFR